ncbi:hypothetical protein MJO29_001529 [Puccinia striiformis f. sp. tritici]|uniref:Uncharacterized protein n=2 Tax=Puccinia striiformis TaxID=27350 RepID=A0A2S4WCM2_9BASI|nr:hypothetical protein MJO29_001529 [Puccinia striiformis f. sp. tritici]POW19498.1 hypothetical protein PSHT_04619 [Puccinia striiformis]
MRLLEGIVFMGCGLYTSYTFWRSGRKNMNSSSYERQNEKKREGSSTVEMMVRGESEPKKMPNNNKRKKASVAIISGSLVGWAIAAL